MSRPQKWALSGLTLCGILALALYLRQEDLSDPSPLLPRCLLNWTTGAHCPGCGNTRAAQSLLRGDISGAIQQNVVFVAALPLLIWGAARTWWTWINPQTRRTPSGRWKWRHSLYLVALLILFGF
ncbi:MAG: DUF2752 domain-containing protein, partial [Verrucomicrobiota bacterium]